MESRGIFLNLSPLDHRYSQSNPRLWGSLSALLGVVRPEMVTERPGINKNSTVSEVSEHAELESTAATRAPSSESTQTAGFQPSPQE